MTIPPLQKRVLIVDDSPAACRLLEQWITADASLVVVGVAHNGQEAIRMTAQLKPDAVTMDIVMPLMDGLEATKQIMAYTPTPILIFASSVGEQNNALAFEALSYGALDVIEKKDIPTIDLAARIKAIASVKVISHPLAKLERMRKQQPFDRQLAASEMIVALAASTGGPQALLTVLKQLPEDFPCGLVIVQHISAGFTQGLADWMDRECHIKVKLAVDGERISAGIAYVAPTGSQMRLGKGGVICLTDEPPCLGHKPSATILFESASEVYGSRAIGIILTGMGTDGAAGLLKLHAASGKVIAQDEKTSVVFGMPKAAIDSGSVDWVLPIDHVAGQLMTILNVSTVRPG